VALKRSLRALEEAAANASDQTASMQNNLLALMVDAARAKATVGEMSDALETSFGRHVAEIRSLQGVYRRELSGKTAEESVGTLDDMIAKFEKNEGRRPRILVAKMGQDGHDRGQTPAPSLISALMLISGRSFKRRLKLPDKRLKTMFISLVPARLQQAT